MQYFMDTTETIPGGVGFSLFGSLHLVWLGIFLAITAASIIYYRKLSLNGRGIWKFTIAALLAGDEIFKVVMLVIGGRYLPSYLPLHLCSINIFLIIYHTIKPSRLVSGYLYTVGVPGAIAALLFPSWTSLPLTNFMHLHSFTVHILLALYPITLAAAGELGPEIKKIPQYLLLLVAMAAPIYVVNLILDTNFMFLMSADQGNPLYLFEQLWGNHLYGFPVLITAVLLVMYVPLAIFRKIKTKK